MWLNGYAFVYTRLVDKAVIHMPYCVLSSEFTGYTRRWVMWSWMPCCCCCSVAKSLWPCGLQHTRLPCPSFSPVSWNLLKLMSIVSVMPCNHLILCQLEVVTDHFILEALRVEIEREREREKGRREKKWREGSLEKQTDTSFGGEDNGVTNLTDGRKQEEDKPPSNQNTNGSSSCSFWNHFHSEELCAVG